MEKNCLRVKDPSRQELARTAQADGIGRHNTDDFFPLWKSLFWSEALFSIALGDCGHFLTRFSYFVQLWSGTGGTKCF